MATLTAIMARRKPYTLVYARGVTTHLKAIDAKYDRLIRETIEEQLRFEPAVETKNRKPLRQPAPFAAQWEIRFGPDNRFRACTTSTSPSAPCRSWQSGKKTAIA
jgi:hypothetical protein